jgi:exodeoxyribonuclease III
MSVRIVSYNVNGIRSVLQKGFADWLKAVDAEVVCLQEVKALPEQLDLSIFENMGYETFWCPANKKGYSGVAIFSKIPYQKVVKGCGIDIYDTEGRVIRIDFETFSVLNVYMPSGSSGELRQTFKMQWLDDFEVYLSNLLQIMPNLIVCGDYNICHQAIDIHNPKANAQSSGFLPEERDWLGKLLKNGFTDSFRHFNQEPHNYTWWSYRAGARHKNLGWRIDYHLVSHTLVPQIKRSVILRETHFSDHCPILLEID